MSSTYRSTSSRRRDDFIQAGTEGLKSRPVSLAEKRLKAAQAKIGELNMQVEILQEYLKKKGLWPPRRCSGSSDPGRRVETARKGGLRGTWSQQVEFLRQPELRKARWC
ncbi:MAG: hypothetical protein HPY90_13410 [Syntrophothermus sp.]|uniref:hypothetical protein n=1 Tax=Syntrophothermus sp. TaxID=2736299 RepID=UPI002580E043|nr:hypothetical protein [Syntrophothermus sp.]NSW84244.1 hypothetical protein [Syntrophothermus sp.]